MTAVMDIPIELIRTDGGTQIRCSTYYDKVEEYAQLMKDGVALPPLVVFFDGAEYWLADGFHREAAHNAIREALERDSIDVPCDVRDGTLRDAILYSCGANAEHGIQRTDDDKRNAVDTVLKNPLVLINPETGEPWGDREIGRICNVSPTLVGKRRAKLTVHVDSQRTYRHNKSGKPTVMNTAGINKDRAADKPEPKQESSEQETDDKAEPAKVIKFVTEWDYLYTLTRRIDEAIAALPEPDVAVRNFPVALSHAMPVRRALEIQHWWQEFTRYWQARDPEFQRFRQQQRDFVQEEMNARAH
jgi:hypothetical protein